MGTDEECDHLLFIVRKSYAPVCKFSVTAFFKNFLLYFMWLHLDAEQFTFLLYMYIYI